MKRKFVFMTWEDGLSMAITFVFVVIFTLGTPYLTIKGILSVWGITSLLVVTIPRISKFICENIKPFIK